MLENRQTRIKCSVALLTPFQENGDVDWPRLASHAASLLDVGLSLVTAFGTTGEGASVAEVERRQLYERMDGAGIPPGKIVECIYATAVDDAVRQVRHACEAGCAAVLAPPPFYFKELTDEGLYAWYATVFDRVGPPLCNIVLYNIPGVTGVKIGLDVIGRLRRAFPGIVIAVKDSSGDWSNTTALLAAHGDLSILVGDERQLAKAVQRGAAGAISGVANIYPDLVMALAAGRDNPRAGALVDAICSVPVVPAIKAIMADLTGDDSWARVRPPIAALSPEAAGGLVGAVRRVMDAPCTGR